MKITKEEAFQKLCDECIVAVEYVGYANYQERENRARSEVRRMFDAFEQAKYDRIVFTDK